MITNHNTAISFETGALTGPQIRESAKKFRDIRTLFRDEAAATAIDPEKVVYRVQYWMPVTEGTPGGLFWGTTTLMPGKVGKEYFMTHGHLHSVEDRAEFYATIKGQGALILMNVESGHTWGEPMHPGSLHYISGGIAHRVANTGDEPLVFTACWPSDAGHNYADIRENGFGARLCEVNRKPVLEPEEAHAGARR